MKSKISGRAASLLPCRHHRLVLFSGAVVSIMNRYKREKKRRKGDPDLEPLPEEGTLSKEEWFEELNRHDPLEQPARRQAERRNRRKQPPWIAYSAEDRYDWKIMTGISRTTGIAGSSPWSTRFA